MIVGAGTFGASLAWWLAGRGDEIVLVDQFEPGDVRATSGGETRLIRCSHGSDGDYAAMARRARTLWRELEAQSGADLLSECGVSWFAHREEGWEAASLRTLSGLGIPAERESVAQAGARFPSFNGDDLAWVLHEPEAGVLRAQRAVRALATQAAARGATIVRGRARPAGDVVVLDDGAVLEGDRVVWSMRRLAGAAVSGPDPPAPSRARSCSSSTAGRRGATRPAGSTTTARPTGRATSTRSA